MKGFYPAVAMKVPPGKSRTECEELVLRFLSTLSWVEERSFMVEGGGLIRAGPPGRLPLPAAHPFPTQLLVPWPSIEPHGSRPSFTPRRLAAARTAFVRAEIIPA